MSDPGRPDEQEPVIRDRRRIDPQTGLPRETGATAPGSPAGPAGDAPIGPESGNNPFPGGRHAADDPGDPNTAAQPLNIDAGIAGAELELAKQEAAERTADLQRVTAEYANYRRRVDRDREQVVTSAKGTVVSELLPVLDDLDRARAHGDLTGSFGTVADKLVAALRKLGLEPVGAEGEAFDPARHEAVQFGTSTDVTEPTVTSVFRSGYTLGDKLLRPAVVVVTGPEHGSSGDTAADPAADAAGS